MIITANRVTDNRNRLIYAVLISWRDKNYAYFELFIYFSVIYLNI